VVQVANAKTLVFVHCVFAQTLAKEKSTAGASRNGACRIPLNLNFPRYERGHTKGSCTMDLYPKNLASARNIEGEDDPTAKSLNESPLAASSATTMLPDWEAWLAAPINIALGESASSNLKNKTIDGRTFLAMMKSDRVSSRKGGSCFAPVQLINDAPAPPGKKNICSGNIATLSALVYDLDRGHSIDEVAAKLKADEVAYFGYHSFNSGTTTTNKIAEEDFVTFVRETYPIRRLRMLVLILRKSFTIFQRSRTRLLSRPNDAWSMVNGVGWFSTTH
jgi:hypothetical protein